MESLIDDDLEKFCLMSLILNLINDNDESNEQFVKSLKCILRTIKT